MIFFYHRCSSFDVYKTRKFKFVRSTNDHSNAVDLLLCKQCVSHLTMEPKDKKKDKTYDFPQNTWPAFIWSLLSDDALIQTYHSRIWQLIPQPWRYWWIDNAIACFYDRISLDIPESLFIDKTLQMEEWDSDIDSMSLSRLRDTSNKHLMPCVLCPWGCTEFYHE